MVEEIQGKIVSYLSGVKDNGIVLPKKPSKSKYNDIPDNIGEINGYVLANYLAHWTAITNWAGYNLASLKAKEDYLKRYISLIKKERYLEITDSMTIKDKDARVETNPEVMRLEEEFNDLRLQCEMMSSIYNANVRTLSLFSREISRRSASFREDYSDPKDNLYEIKKEDEDTDY